MAARYHQWHGTTGEDTAVVCHWLATHVRRLMKRVEMLETSRARCEGEAPRILVCARSVIVSLASAIVILNTAIECHARPPRYTVAASVPSLCRLLWISLLVASLVSDVATDNERALMSALGQQPVSVAIEADSPLSDCARQVCSQERVPSVSNYRLFGRAVQRVVRR